MLVLTKAVSMAVLLVEKKVQNLEDLRAELMAAPMVHSMAD